MSDQKKIFISYSWDSAEHKAWVKKFSDDLQVLLGDGFEVLLDQNLKKGTSLSRFIKRGLEEAAKVLIIGTPNYKAKSQVSGGVAYETMVITNEMISNMDTDKFYPILRSGKDFNDSFPTDIKDKIGDNFTDDKKYLENLQIVADALIEEFKLQDNLIFTVGNISFKMIHVEGGTFEMGATPEQVNDAEEREYPTHLVTLDEYWIGETPVTQELWELVMGYNPSYFSAIRNYKNTQKRPVEQVTWHECRDFIFELNNILKKELLEAHNMTFYLPTEAQWEFAARGGNKRTKAAKYSGGDEIENVAWYLLSPEKETHSVGYKKIPNELGIYDMSGNVWEWCEDAYGVYSEEPQKNPIYHNEETTTRIARGGCWHSNHKNCRVSFRGYPNMLHAGNGLGLRLVLSSKRE